MFFKKQKLGSEFPRPMSLRVEDSGRLDIPVYLDAGAALSLYASLNRGVALESSVETASHKETGGRVSAGGVAVPFLEGELLRTSETAVTENEVRKQTQESIFNAARSSLQASGLLNDPVSPWAEAEWEVGEFVEFTAERFVVPLVSVLSRLRVITDAFSYATGELSVEALQEKIPKLLAQMRGEAPGSKTEDDVDVDTFLSFLAEAGELSRALSGLILRLEAEAESSGLVDIVMFERGHEGHLQRPESSPIIIVASLDRDYVDTKLLRRLGQGTFGVLGKVLRTPAPGTAFNAFRNSMLGSTNQLPVLISKYSDLLFQLPLILGDGVNVGDEGGESAYFDFVGSASAITELRPLWLMPSVEILPVAIYA